MHLRPVWYLIRREADETISDWRILLPMLILSTVLPSLLLGTAIAVAGAMGQASANSVVLPIAMLLSGVTPAFFGLITAIESFVGERERNSLDALLALPLRDNEIYLGKLIASLLPPMVAAYLAVCVFVVVSVVLQPGVLATALPLHRVALIMLLIGGKALIMVTGATIISAHTSSVRAANLMAALIIVPVMLCLQLETLAIFRGRWDVLMIALIVLLIVALCLVRAGVITFRREALLSREARGPDPQRLARTFLLFLREYQPAGVAPAAYRSAPFTLKGFYLHDMPRILSEFKAPLGLSIIGLAAGLVIGSALGSLLPPDAPATLAKALGYSPAASPKLILAIITANAIKTFLSSLLSLVALGFFAFLIPMATGLRIGMIVTLLARLGPWATLEPSSPLPFLLAYVLPHGLLEIPVILLCAALGIRMGASVFATPTGAFTIGTNLLWSTAQFIKIWVLVALPLLILAGVTKGLAGPVLIAHLYGG